MVRDWPDMSPSTRADSMFLYRNSFQNGFYDSSWTADVMQQVASANNGMRGGAGLCANIHAGVSHISASTYRMLRRITRHSKGHVHDPLTDPCSVFENCC